MAKYLMAIDAGTGSVRAVLFDLEGNQLGCSQQEWEHVENPRYPGSMDFDWYITGSGQKLHPGCDLRNRNRSSRNRRCFHYLHARRHRSL